MSTPDILDELPVGIEDAARALGCSRRWLEDWLAEHPGHGYKIGRIWKFTQGDMSRMRMALSGNDAAIAALEKPSRPPREAGWADLPQWARVLYKAAKARSVKIDRPFLLTYDDMWWLVVESDGHCQLTGIAFDWRGDGRRRPFAASIDRLDNARGYEAGNVRLVCAIANYAMNDWGELPLKIMARAIVAREQKIGENG